MDAVQVGHEFPDAHGRLRIEIVGQGPAIALLVIVAQPVIDLADLIAVGGGDIVGIVLADIAFKMKGGFFRALLGDDVDHRHLGVGVKHRRRVFGYFDFGDNVHRDLVQIQLAVIGFIIGNAVDEKEGLFLVEAVHGYFRFVLSAPGNGDARRESQGVGHGFAVQKFEILEHKPDFPP